MKLGRTPALDSSPRWRMQRIVLVLIFLAALSVGTVSIVRLTLAREAGSVRGPPLAGAARSGKEPPLSVWESEVLDESRPVDVSVRPPARSLVINDRPSDEKFLAYLPHSGYVSSIELYCSSIDYQTC